MEKHFTSIIRFCITVIFVSSVIFSPAQSWLNVGTTGAGCGQMDMDASGNVYVYDGSTVKKFDGTNWSDWGNPVIGAGASTVYYKHLTVSASGTVYFTFHFGTATMPPTSIKSYTSVNSGSGFTLLGGADMMNGIETHFPCFDGETMTGVVTDATTATKYIKVRAYNSGWLTINSIPISGMATTNNNAAMDHDNSGNAYLLFYDGGYKLYKITGSTVTQLGSTLTGVSNHTSSSKIPFCVSPGGDAYFGLINSSGGYRLTIYKFNGTTWDLFESDNITDPNTITGVTNLSIEVGSSGIIYAGYNYTTSTGSGAKVVHYTGNGTTWSDVGTINIAVSALQITSGNMLYASGCRKFDASGITLGVVAADESLGVQVSTDANGLRIDCKQAPIAVEVYDLNGKLVSTAPDRMDVNTVVPLQQEGMYIVKVETTSGVMTKKVVFVR